MVAGAGKGTSVLHNHREIFDRFAILRKRAGLRELFSVQGPLLLCLQKLMAALLGSLNNPHAPTENRRRRSGSRRVPRLRMSVGQVVPSSRSYRERIAAWHSHALCISASA